MLPLLPPVLSLPGFVQELLLQLVLLLLVSLLLLLLLPLLSVPLLLLLVLLLLLPQAGGSGPETGGPPRGLPAPLPFGGNRLRAQGLGF